MRNKSLDFKLISFREGWKSLEEDWLRLFRRCSRPCVFYHPLFLNAAETLSLQEQPTHLVMGYQGSDLVFGLPVRLSKCGLIIKELSFYTVSNIGFDHLAPLDNTPNLGASREFLKHFDQYRGLKVLKANNMDAEVVSLLEENGKKKFKFFKRHAFCCPYLELPGTEDELFISLSSNLRSQIRRRLKQAETGSIEFRIIIRGIHGYSLQDAFNNLYRLHTERFYSVGRSSKFLTPGSRKFHIHLCKEAHRFEGFVHFFEALHEGRVIGSLYGYLVADRFYFQQSGFDPEYLSYSVGVLIKYKAMLYLISKGVKVFDFLRGVDTYKLRWTKSYTEDFLVFASPSPIGRVAVNLLRLQRAIRREGRRKGLWHWLCNKD